VSTIQTFSVVKEEGTCAIAQIARKPQELASRSKFSVKNWLLKFSFGYTAAAHNLTIENEKITIEGAENLIEYTDTKTLSGTPLGRFFCKTCGKFVQRGLCIATELIEAVLSNQ
jgi:hypothetical protein